MTLLIPGILLWWAGHFFKRVLPGLHDRLGAPAKAISAVVILAGLALIVIGFRGAEFIPVYVPPSWGLHVNNLAMVAAVVLMGVGSSKSPWRGRIRHPMLTGALVWALAHLLVNGDLASVLLFGAMGLWAVSEILVINARDPAPEPYAEGTTTGTIRLLAISAVVFVVIVAIHTWLGYRPIPG